MYIVYGYGLGLGQYKLCIVNGPVTGPVATAFFIGASLSARAPQSYRLRNMLRSLNIHACPAPTLVVSRYIRQFYGAGGPQCQCTFVY